MKKSGSIIFFILLFGCLGYAREFFFVHMNNILYQKYYHTTSSLAVPPSMHFFERFSYATLYYSKYIFTLLWTSAFFISSYVALNKLTANAVALKLLIYAYCLLLIIAGISMAYGFLVKQHLQNDEYTLSRWLLGIAQSPIICLILLASEKLYNKSIPS
jgi:hypothetical protein